MTFAQVIDGLDGFAGFAAVINGLILWPVVRSLKRDHGRRLTALETARTRRARRRKTP